MVEYATHIEAYDAVTCATVYGWNWMILRWPDRRNAMAGIAAEVRDHGGGMVGIGAEETDSRVAIAAFRSSFGVRRCRRLTNRHGAVVATDAGPGYSSMIEAAVRAQRQKTGGIVAVIAFGAGRLMKLGFPDCQNAVMALTALAKHFLMIDIGNYVKTQRGMAGFAHTTGGEVIRRFPRDLARAR